jgi:hypothetical protein
MTTTQKSAKSTTATDKTSKRFSKEERDAMKERAKELKAAAGKADEEKAVLAKIAEMPGPDRAMAERIHAIVKASAPALSPGTARSSAFSRPRRSSRSGTRRSASMPMRTSTRARCGRPRGR